MSGIMIALGALFLAGLLTDLLGRRTLLPRITLLMAVGFAIGPSGFDLLPGEAQAWFPFAMHAALMMVGFLLGGRLSLGQLRKQGRRILGIAGAKVAGAFVVIAGGLMLVGFAPELALLLGAIGVATDPAAVSEVVREVDGEGPVSDALLGVVALDDAFGLALFSVTLASVEMLAGTAGAGESLLMGAREIVGGLALGIAFGVPAAYATARISHGEPTLTEALGVVFLCGGLALWLEVSFLLSTMALGATIASLGRHHRRPFHAIEGIEWPFMIVFFGLTGASFHVGGLAGMGVLVALYVVLRSVGTVFGALWSARRLGVQRDAAPWLGAGLLPQGGVALGMALVSAERLPDLADTLLHTTIAAVLLFELGGPVLTRIALQRVGEARPRAA